MLWQRTWALIFVVSIGFSSCNGEISDAEIRQKKQKMLTEIENDLQQTKNKTGISELSSKVKQAIESVPREKFVPDNLQKYAYENKPLAIGEGQTISQPFIVALMTELLNVKPTSKILEVGTGSGYQAAVLSRIAAHIYSIERISSLANTAKERLARLGFNNVTVITGDGTKGLVEEQPFDGIIVTAGGKVTQALKDQLKNGARLVIPVERGDTQLLTVFTKDINGKISEQQVLDVKFVPLIPDR